MKVKEIIESKLFDENEQVTVLKGDVNCPSRLYTGYLHQIPSELYKFKIEQISAMGEYRRINWNLNKYGWMEIWIEEE